MLDANASRELVWPQLPAVFGRSSSPDKALTPPRQGLNIAWILCRIAQHLANLVDGSVQIVVDVDGPILYASCKETKLRLLERATLQGDNMNKVQRAFAVLHHRICELARRP